MKYLKIFYNLTKPNLLKLVLISVFVGYFLGAEGKIGITLLYCILGSFLIAGGASVFNNVFEYKFDALMERTANREIPTGQIKPNFAALYGIILILLGISVLYTLTNSLTLILALSSALWYVAVYTPLKRISWLNTFVGSISGALPPLWGWTAAGGELNLKALVLFLIVYFWQEPHFFAIAWIYRQEYSIAGFKMLSVSHPNIDITYLLMIIFSILTVAVSVLPFIIGLNGIPYLMGCILIGFYFIYKNIQSYKNKYDIRKLIMVSVKYLNILFLVMVLDVILLNSFFI